MRLNPKTVAISFLQEKYPMNFCVSRQTEATQLAFFYIEKQFPVLRGGFRKKAQLITRPFHEAFQKAFDKLIDHLIDEQLEEAGTMIFPAENGSALTLFYQVKVKLNNSREFSITGNAFGFSNGDYPGPRLTVFLSLKEDQGMAFSPDDMCDEQSIKAIVVRAVLIRQFMRLCEVETKYVEPGKKTHADGVKFRNESKITVEVISCTWFTNIVRTAGFWVGKETGGFYRFQPYGPGLKQKRFVWIKPFEKTGYTIKARASNQSDISEEIDGGELATEPTGSNAIIPTVPLDGRTGSAGTP